MGILDKAKEIGGKVSESVTAFCSDEVIANTIIKAVEKQEKVNAFLCQCNSGVVRAIPVIGETPSDRGRRCRLSCRSSGLLSRPF